MTSTPTPRTTRWQRTRTGHFRYYKGLTLLVFDKKLWYEWTVSNREGKVLAQNTHPYSTRACKCAASTVAKALLATRRLERRKR